MLSYTELAPKKIVLLDENPHEIISTSGVIKKQRQKPHNTAKLRNILTGATMERTFSQADRIEEADIETKEIKYLFTNNKNESWFCAPDNPTERFNLSVDVIANQLPYMRENDVVEALVFGGDIYAVRVPIKVDLEVAEAPPNIKGGTAQGGTKQVTLETGLVITAPMFVETGDTVRVNTETGEYVERV